VIRKGVAIQEFPIGRFVSVDDGSEVTTGTVAGTYSNDGAAGTLSGTISYDATANEWRIDEVTAEEMDGDIIGLSFTLDGAVPIHFTISTAQPQVSVTLGAIQSSRDPGNRTSSPIALEMFQAETKTFALTCEDAAGDPVDLSSRTLRFVVQDSNDPPSAQFKVEGASIAVSGSNNDVANVTVSAMQSATAGCGFHWRLWDVVADEVLLHGSFTIKSSLKDVS